MHSKMNETQILLSQKTKVANFSNQLGTATLCSGDFTTKKIKIFHIWFLFLFWKFNMVTVAFNMIKCAEIILFTILSPLAISLSMYSDIGNQSSKRTSSWNASDVEGNLSEWTFVNCVVQIHIGASTTKLYFMMFQKMWRHRSQKIAGTLHRKNDILQCFRNFLFPTIMVHPLTPNRKETQVFLKNVSSIWCWYISCGSFIL